MLFSPYKLGLFYMETFWKTNEQRKLRIHNITAKAAWKFGSEAWVLNKREEQRLEVAQVKFLRHLLGITKLDKEKNFDVILTVHRR